jgi:hypothetical protein
VATLDIMALIELTALFAMFAVAMAGAQALLRRNTAARVTVETPRKRKRRPF